MSGTSYRRVAYRPEEEEYLRTPEAARRLGVNGREVFRLIDEGVLRVTVDDRGHTYVPRADLEEYLRRSA